MELKQRTFGHCENSGGKKEGKEVYGAGKSLGTAKAGGRLALSPV